MKSDKNTDGAKNIPAMSASASGAGTFLTPRPELTASSLSASSAGFVRQARPEDLSAIGQAHAQSMLASLRAGHEGPLPASVEAMISAPVIAAGWEGALQAPPSLLHHVLVATQDDAVVGLAAIVPGTNDAPADPDDAQPADKATTETVTQHSVDVLAIAVAPAHQRQGHGSRLLAACADLARAGGARSITVWAVKGDDSQARLLVSSGLAPSGLQRIIPVGDGVTEVCWHASL